MLLQQPTLSWNGFATWLQDFLSYLATKLLVRPTWIKSNLFFLFLLPYCLPCGDCVFASFVPFFVNRLQPNVDTRQKQLAAWCSLVLSYCRHHKLYTLDVMEAQESPVFNNKKTERILTDQLWISSAFHSRLNNMLFYLFSNCTFNKSSSLSFLCLQLFNVNFKSRLCRLECTFPL